MDKEKAKTTQNDKGKAKETAQDKENPDDTETKRKWTQKTSENSLFDITSDNEDGTSADEAEPPAKRVRRKKSIDDVGIIPAPPPCHQCTVLQIECEPNGWSAACKNCRKVRQTCSLSTALPNDKGKANETADDDEKVDDTEKPNTQRLRKTRTSIYTLTKSILDDDRSSIEDEDVDQLDETPTKPIPKKKVSTTAIDGFIPNDPNVRL